MTVVRLGGTSARSGWFIARSRPVAALVALLGSCPVRIVLRAALRCRTLSNRQAASIRSITVILRADGDRIEFSRRPNRRCVIDSVAQVGLAQIRASEIGADQPRAAEVGRK